MKPNRSASTRSALVKSTYSRALLWYAFQGKHAKGPIIRYLWARKTWINGYAYAFLVDSAGFAPYDLPIFRSCSARVRE